MDHHQLRADLQSCLHAFSEIYTVLHGNLASYILLLAQGRMGVVGTHFIDNYLMLVGEKCVSVGGMVDTRPMQDCRNNPDDDAFMGGCIQPILKAFSSVEF
jgi:hypothetical protein